MTKLRITVCIALPMSGSAVTCEANVIVTPACGMYANQKKSNWNLVNLLLLLHTSERNKAKQRNKTKMGMSDHVLFNTEISIAAPVMM